MHIGRTSVTLGILLSAGLMAGCTVYTHSSSSKPPPRGHSTHSSHGSSGSSSSSSSSSSGSSWQGGSAPGQQTPAEPAANPMAPSNTKLTSMRKRMLGVGGHNVGRTDTSLDVPPWNSGRPQLLNPGVAAGRPPGFRPGAPAAYWIWQGPRGDWRLRTTTKSAPHVFRGRFKGMSSGINTVEPTRAEYRDRIAHGNDGWMFNFRTQGHADGFTFSVPDGGCVQFDLQLDGGPVQKKIYVGGRQFQPSSSFFVVCPEGMTPPAAATPGRKVLKY